jgi:hypothetical protein
MRRDHFTVAAQPDATEPTIVIEFDGPADTLTERLGSDDVPAADDVDAAVRLQDPVDREDAAGVLSLTRRLTGEYLLEANVTAEGILAVVDAAREADETSYRVRIDRPETGPVEYEKGTLLVYDDEGSLLRQHSLIPSGVEL